MVVLKENKNRRYSSTESNRCRAELSGFDRRDGMTAALAVEARSFCHLQCKLGGRVVEAGKV